MKTASIQNELATLSTVLLSNLDEVVFFSKLSGFVQDVMNEHKVLGFEVLSDGCTRLVSENGHALSSAKLLNKGQGLSGYVARMKRAYYSNSVKRDPIASTGLRDDAVEAELCMPIMVEGSVIGTINVQSTKKDRNFGEGEIVILNDILAQLQSPIRNMHLYLMAKNLNRELMCKIEAKEKELSNRVEIQVTKGLEDNSQMIGLSKNFLEIVQTAKKVAGQDFPVLLEGNHGVGKKILARKIHTWSGRKGGVVVASCGAFNEVQLDREIFSSKGLMVQANGGTLIIDDIGSTSQYIQTKLLRALVAGEMIAVDTEEKIALNVRLIATSKVSLKDLVEAGSFKEELFYRLNTVALKIPSLKERHDDIKVMAEHFLNSGKAEKKVLTSGAIEKLTSYFWPGNAHELKNIMERTYILTDGQYIEASHLPEFAVEVKVEKVEAPAKYVEFTLFDLEKKHIIDTLDHLGGNKTRAAKALGITVKTLYNKLHSYGLIEAREQ
ncbi:sigma-54-dependent Fis family transcriptional regulator [Peredibacter starrii]|uniref:Sigma 54-interacting transcriptional regulator n=1 Tax=Peredibacter starrii TaxID=28202 RepID=A0AAX4HMM6_9BACT|nr:sigma 54-interacting transcriptional regulator [Peredibacter starrii]WPU64456.1 sigma 54-interacting transcriptional regulator [Peredibacter starrii]